MYKNQSFGHNPVDNYLKRRNTQSVRALWSRFCRKHNYALMCKSWSNTVSIYDISSSKEILDLHSLMPKILDLEIGMWSCIPYYGYELKNIAKIAIKNHEENIYLFKKIEDIILKNIKNNE